MQSTDQPKQGYSALLEGQDDHYIILPQMDVRGALIFLDFFRSKG